MAESAPHPPPVMTAAAAAASKLLVVSDTRLDLRGQAPMFQLSPFKIAHSDLVAFHTLLLQLRRDLAGVTHLFVNGKLSTTLAHLLIMGYRPDDLTPELFFLHYAINLQNLKLSLFCSPVWANQVLISHLPRPSEIAQYIRATVAAHPLKVRGIVPVRPQKPLPAPMAAADGDMSLPSQEADFACTLFVLHSPSTNTMLVLGRDEAGNRVHRYCPNGDPGVWVGIFGKKANMVNHGVSAINKHVPGAKEVSYSEDSMHLNRLCYHTPEKPCVHGGGNTSRPSLLVRLPPDPLEPNGFPADLQYECARSRCVRNPVAESTPAIVFNSHLTPNARFQLNRGVKFRCDLANGAGLVKTGLLLKLDHVLLPGSVEPLTYSSSPDDGNFAGVDVVFCLCPAARLAELREASIEATNRVYGREAADGPQHRFVQPATKFVDLRSVGFSLDRLEGVPRDEILGVVTGFLKAQMTLEIMLERFGYMGYSSLAEDPGDMAERTLFYVNGVAGRHQGKLLLFQHLAIDESGHEGGLVFNTQDELAAAMAKMDSGGGGDEEGGGGGKKRKATKMTGLKPQGIHRGVKLLDFSACYPHQIIHLNASPEGDGVLPDLIKTFLRRREELKTVSEPLSLLFKLMANVFYGWLSFYFPFLAELVILGTKKMLLTSAKYLQDNGCGVIQGDTDSLFSTPPPDGDWEEDGSAYLPGLHKLLREDFGAVIKLEANFHLFIQCQAKKEYLGVTSTRRPSEVVTSSIIDPSQPPFFRKLLLRVITSFCVDNEEGDVSAEFLAKLARGIYKQCRLPGPGIPITQALEYATRHNINLESLLQLKNKVGEDDSNLGNRYLLALINDCTVNKIRCELDPGHVFSLPCRLRGLKDPAWKVEDFLSESKSSQKYDVAYQRLVAQHGDHVIHADYLWRNEFFAPLARTFSRPLQQSEKELLKIMVKAALG